jgi:hypothetical protein
MHSLLACYRCTNKHKLGVSGWLCNICDKNTIADVNIPQGITLGRSESVPPKYMLISNLTSTDPDFGRFLGHIFYEPFSDVILSRAVKFQ